MGRNKKRLNCGNCTNWENTPFKKTGFCFYWNDDARRNDEACPKFFVAKCFTCQTNKINVDDPLLLCLVCRRSLETDKRKAYA